jgi:RNA polymerase sigma factor (sigma-70 family)
MKRLGIHLRPRSQRGTIVQKLAPSARLPGGAIAERLGPHGVELLSERLSEPVECVFHPDFRRASMPGEEVDVSRVVDQRLNSVPTDLDAGPAHHTPTEVLTADEERSLFFRFNYCRYRVLRILARFRGRRLTISAARDLLAWDARAQGYRTDIVRANTSLVLAMARRSRNSGVELGELVSEGNLALLRCVDKFDAARGFKFSTYACRAILASFSRAGAKAARLRAQFPTPYDPAMERSDYLETKRERTEFECVDELKRILFENSADLSPVERRVLSARFSLDQPASKTGGRRKTLDQVGDLLGVSKERVRQIQNQAMIKLRAVLEERLLAAS